MVLWIVGLGLGSFILIILLYCVHLFRNGSVKEGFIVILVMLVVIALLAGFWIEVADPFCQDGYITEDGSCAWE